jgi:hypothetical protein
MAKNKTWETKNRIYTRSHGRTTYINKPKQGKTQRLLAGGNPDTQLPMQNISTGRISHGASNVSERTIPETPEETIQRLDKVVRELGHKTMDIPHNWPTSGEIDQLIWAAETRAKDALASTKKEGTRQDLELTLHHLRIARRYFNKALAI